MALDDMTTGLEVEAFSDSIVEAAIAAASRAASTGFKKLGSEGKSASARTAGRIPESKDPGSSEKNSGDRTEPSDSVSIDGESVLPIEDGESPAPLEPPDFKKTFLPTLEPTIEPSCK
jgi:hypothetical protein